VLAVGRLPLRISRLALFTTAAVCGALITFLVCARVEHLLHVNRSTTPWLNLVGSVFACIWFASRGRFRISLRCRQVHRSTTRGRYTGPTAFGFLLGLGWWTWVSSPFLWVGLLASTLQGNAIQGGLVYGVGRSVTAIYGVCSPVRARSGLDPVLFFGRYVGRAMFLATPWVAAAAAAVSLSVMLR
jgi:hypothetical protein